MTDKTTYLVFNSGGSMEQVSDPEELQRRLMAKPEAMLRREIANALTYPQSNYQQAAAVSQMELDRRAFEASKNLARRTTWISAGVGVLGTVIGVLLGAWLNGGGAP